MVEAVKIDSYFNDWTLMDIKIGFTENPRELVISAADKRDELLAKLSEGMNDGSRIITLTDAKDRTYLIKTEDIAYVEVGSDSRPAVGFGGI